MAEHRRLPSLRRLSLSAFLVAVVALAGACSTEDPATTSSDPDGDPTSESSVDALDTTSVPSPTLTADDGGTSTTGPTSTTETEQTSTTASEPVDNPIPGCEAAEARVEPLDEALSSEMEQVRSAILEAQAACDLDRLLALTDPTALISDPGDEPVLVLNFGDQEPLDFATLPFEIIPDVLNGSWTTSQSDAGVDIASFSNGSHQLQLSADGRWAAFLIVVS